jgi:hypothetical protein
MISPCFALVAKHDNRFRFREQGGKYLFKMSPVGGGANRSLSEVDCGDEFGTTIAKFNWEVQRRASRHQASDSIKPPDDDGSDDGSCGEACSFAAPRGGRTYAQ